MKNIYQKNKLLIIVLSYLVLMAGFTYLLIIPEITNIKNIADKIQEKIIDNQILEKRLEKIPEMDKDYADFQDKRALLEAAIDPSDKVAFIKKLEALADITKNKVSIKVVEEENKTPDKAKAAPSPAKKGPEPGIKEKLAYAKYFSLELTVIGEYGNLVKFVHQMENAYNYVNIISLDIKKLKEKDLRGVAGPSPADIFSAQAGAPKADDAKDAKDENKEILNSKLNVVVYTK